MQAERRRERLRIARAIGCHRFTKNEEGQMMLLTAFVLVIGFVALSAMVARMSQLSEGTRQAADRPIYVEAEAVAKGVEVSMTEMNELIAPRADGGNMDAFNDAVEGSMKHLTVLESARGYRLRLTDPAEIGQASNPWCDDTGPDGIPGNGDDVAVVSTTFSLGDPSTSISFTIAYTPLDIYDGTHQDLDYDVANGGTVGVTAQGTGDPTDPAYQSNGYTYIDDEDVDTPVTECSGGVTSYP